ncbi:uncharacterized protein BO88DRAFT_429340 [Aspergillus vadensis CBS 113365]|uniref:Uncharacterized protein n=2 Tax=Aspergillus subgen. Circumdati TaxID=2720871 RepID=A0A319AXD2_ASPVC|nr:hypothetical protein BO87DRAFT_401211 [Aspergillus neoniger CBS 115656]XP_025558703.1 hypothetical protein BO88DRAFT_429340 [Aspergillus vadensis CBS 113365]PYH29549.1 hypothetical protein BO87DRAFT_401211 [Aspergillus neoniger CBS 115656]PYH64909.1 hypothetical protein BO88DRAFT_429340 [Aspergillus vadensis CBS 113365]
MANNWREKAALAVNAQVASTHQEPFPPPPCRASLAGGVSPERAIAQTHASFNFTSNQPEAACRGCGSQPFASRRSWPIARQLQSCRVLSSQLAAASFCQDVRHPMNDSNSTVHPSH